MAIGIAHNFGYSNAIQWCPSGGYQLDTDGQDSHQHHHHHHPHSRLGVLAAACSVGFVVIYAIPLPDQQLQSIYRPDPVAVLKPSRGSDHWYGQCLCLDWSRQKGHSKIAAGFGNGSVAIWNLLTTSQLLTDQNGNLYPIQLLYVGHTILSGVSLNPTDDHYLLVVGSDRCTSIWDTRSPDCPLNDVVHCGSVDCSWPLYHNVGFVSTEKIGASSKGCTVYMLDTGVLSFNSAVLPLHDIVWSFSISDWLHCVAAGAEDGKVAITMYSAKGGTHKPRAKALVASHSVVQNKPGTVKEHGEEKKLEGRHYQNDERFSIDIPENCNITEDNSAINSAIIKLSKDTCDSLNDSKEEKENSNDKLIREETDTDLDSYSCANRTDKSKELVRNLKQSSHVGGQLEDCLDNQNSLQEHGRTSGDDLGKRMSNYRPVKRISGDESAKRTPHDESIKGVSGDESAKETSGDESAKRISVDDSAKGIAADESAKRISGDESAEGIAGAESIKRISGDESTKGIAGAESIKRISGDESTKGIAGDESIKRIFGDELIQRTPCDDSRNRLSGVESPKRISDVGSIKTISSDESIKRISSDDTRMVSCDRSIKELEGKAGESGPVTGEMSTSEQSLKKVPLDRRKSDQIIDDRKHSDEPMNHESTTKENHGTESEHISNQTDNRYNSREGRVESLYGKPPRGEMSKKRESATSRRKRTQKGNTQEKELCIEDADFDVSKILKNGHISSGGDAMTGTVFKDRDLSKFKSRITSWRGRYEITDSEKCVVYRDYFENIYHSASWKAASKMLLSRDLPTTEPEEVFPLNSVTKVVWSPNYNSHRWLLVAGGNGIVRAVHFDCFRS